MKKYSDKSFKFSIKCHLKAFTPNYKMEPDHEQIVLPKVYEEAIREIIKNNLRKSFDDYEIIYSPGSNKGDNYAGIVHRVQIKDKAEAEIKLSMILKVPPVNPTRRDEFMAKELFIREIEFYDNIFPMFKKFQEEKGIDIKKNGFYQVPYCYKTLTAEPFEALFFDDLKVKGFEMFDRFKEVTKEHVFLVMKSLAKMHAIFYSIKDQNPKLVESYFELRDLFIMFCERKNSAMDAWYESMKKQAFVVINECKDIQLKDKVNAFLEKSIYDLMCDCCDRKKTEPYATLCHGDCWNNNMMFRNDQSGTPNAIRLLDFQIQRYSSPILDLMYYIFGCTVKSLRDKHYQEFLDVYYDELSSFMTRLGSDPKKLFPRDAFESHLKEFGHFGLTMALIILPFFINDVKDAPDMDELAENFKKISESVEIDENAFNFTSGANRDKYSERLLGVCKDMCDLGYI
ncbi:hypothetical protein ACKWTF_006354 [Chironomus riparius]